MPQMAPINWLTLFITFSLIFIMFNIMNYFIYSPMTPKSKNTNKIIMKSMNWKW
uniref:ATP synthase complex subunit 8 n=1 Tax=Orthonevra geniculata TaxID=2719083 RepID=A0A7D7FDW6_9MUSC|nr:ATP synthase F0 subunit 8 [Orthonevra geniculata]QMP96583.1 ATP synthase F0 subunit 8 [Orthonevra geniculata]